MLKNHFIIVLIIFSIFTSSHAQAFGYCGSDRLTSWMIRTTTAWSSNARSSLRNVMGITKLMARSILSKDFKRSPGSQKRALLTLVNRLESKLKNLAPGCTAWNAELKKVKQDISSLKDLRKSRSISADKKLNNKLTGEIVDSVVHIITVIEEGSV